MKFNVKLHQVCDNDDLRPAMQHVYFDGEFIVATNARILVAIHIDDLFPFEKEKEIIIGAKGNFIHKKGFMKMFNKEVNPTPEGFEVPGEHIFVPFHKPNDGMKFPEWKRIIPNFKKTEPIKTIGLSLKLINLLTNALPHERGMHTRVKLSISSITQIILLQPLPTGSHKSYGLIMPVSLNGESNEYDLPKLNSETFLYD